MSRRIFEDERGRTWVVTKLGSSLSIEGKRGDEESLSEIARSCSRKMGVTHTSSGVPVEYINQHRRIWNAIWDRGKVA